MYIPMTSLNTMNNLTTHIYTQSLSLTTIHWPKKFDFVQQNGFLAEGT